MRKTTFEPCIPTPGIKVPDSKTGSKIKHDGYRLIVQREGQRVRLWTRNGHNLSDRYPTDRGGRTAQPQQLVCDRW
jgi:bifunctional non-homologous end joining protein LigD